MKPIYANGVSDSSDRVKLVRSGSRLRSKKKSVIAEASLTVRPTSRADT